VAYDFSVVEKKQGGGSHNCGSGGVGCAMPLARASTLLQTLFPEGAVVAATREPGDAAKLFPEEAAHVQRAVPKRVQEFAAGRLCARRAMAAFGWGDFPIIAAKDRQPIWPASLVGSITHTTGLAAAVVAEKSLIAGVGIDCEVVGHVGTDIWPTICVPAETAWVQSLPQHMQSSAVAFLFSAKEAFYKCQYPLTGEWLDFHDVCVTPQEWGAPCSAFRVGATRRLAIAPYLSPSLLGNYLFDDGFVTAGVAMAPLSPNL
jgi:4'-phosphopantetheinyl transferase EntD